MATEAAGIGSWGVLTITDSTFSGNKAYRGSNPTAGGAISLWSTAKADITGTTFVKNTATGLSKGGAIMSEGTLNVTNCTFFGNSADTHGGAISIEGGTASVTHATISGNTTSGEGAGAYIGGILTLRNTIIAQNTPGGNCVISGGNLTDGAGNLRYPNSDPICVGMYGDPQLQPLTDNGGLTQTMAILPGSAAINQINGANGCGCGVMVDQRGISRPQPAGEACDIGAYEYQWSSGAGGRCYIATAAFGSYLHPYVEVLRMFRDKFLLHSSLGQEFVAWYYRVSPRIADIVTCNSFFGASVRTTLLPVIGFAWLCLKIGVIPSLLLLFAFVIGAVILVRPR